MSESSDTGPLWAVDAHRISVTSEPILLFEQENAVTATTFMDVEKHHRHFNVWTSCPVQIIDGD
jgi:hypothetical protein